MPRWEKSKWRPIKTSDQKYLDYSTIISKLKSRLEIWLSLHRAIKEYNLEHIDHPKKQINYLTIHNWYKEDEKFANLIDALRESLINKARRKLREQIDKDNWSAIQFTLVNRDEDFKQKWINAFIVSSNDVDSKTEEEVEDLLKRNKLI